MSNVLLHQRSVGLTASPEFTKKGLATHAVNFGLLCGHGCAYCSTPALMRTNPFFGEQNTTSFKMFQSKTVVFDPWTAIRVSKKVHTLTSKDIVMLSTVTDPYAPEVVERKTSRECLAEILKNSPAQVRILTKNAAVVNDLDIISSYPGRVTVGLSITAPKEKEHLAHILEPNASTISKRLEAYRQISEAGVRIYGMLCPCIPGLASDPDDFESMLKAVLEFNPEFIWTEPVNPRGPGLNMCVQALSSQGHAQEAGLIQEITKKEMYSHYMCDFIDMATDTADKLGCLDKLKILIYSDGDGLNVDDRSVVWLKRR